MPTTVPGPLIPVGQPVTWTYQVTNGGNSVLTNVEVVDDQGVAVTCPQTALQPGEMMECTGSGTAVAGEYGTGRRSPARVPRARSAPKTSRTTSARSVLVDIQKATNDEDADDPPGPLVPVGAPVTWTYVVTNPGNIPLEEVVVTDDRGVVLTFAGGDTNDDRLLEPSETWRYTGSGTAVPGQYANTATVTAQTPFEEPTVTSATDASHYFGEQSGLMIDKSVDRDAVDVGDTVVFTITVTNTGNTALTNVVVSDPQVPACDRIIGNLAAGQTVTYECQFVVNEAIDNVATVSAAEGTTVSATDDARVAIVAAQGAGTLPFTGAKPIGLLVFGLALLTAGVFASTVGHDRSRHAFAAVVSAARRGQVETRPHVLIVSRSAAASSATNSSSRSGSPWSSQLRTASTTWSNNVCAAHSRNSRREERLHDRARGTDRGVAELVHVVGELRFARRVPPQQPEAVGVLAPDRRAAPASRRPPRARPPCSRRTASPGARRPARARRGRASPWTRSGGRRSAS